MERNKTRWVKRCRADFMHGHVRKPGTCSLLFSTWWNTVADKSSSNLFFDLSSYIYIGCKSAPVSTASFNWSTFYSARVGWSWGPYVVDNQSSHAELILLSISQRTGLFSCYFAYLCVTEMKVSLAEWSVTDSQHNRCLWTLRCRLLAMLVPARRSCRLLSLRGRQRSCSWGSSSRPRQPNGRLQLHRSVPEETLLHKSNPVSIK